MFIRSSCTFFFSGISLYAQDDLEITVEGGSVTLDPGTTAAIAGAFLGFTTFEEVAETVVISIIYLLVGLLLIFSVWKVFAKAGKPGWAAIVPIYNTIVMIEIAGKPLWWFVLLLIPGVNVVFGIILVVALARNFGKGGGYAAGLILLPFVFFPMLAFGSAQYVGGAQPSPGGGPLPDTAG